ncbi:MAG: choice-of-anchor Q domain-containing protein [Aquificaceae bacterium]|nr:choice-of-anchor Q domain-containing protein [Aquificaceae bacterium]
MILLFSFWLIQSCGLNNNSKLEPHTQSQIASRTISASLPQVDCSVLVSNVNELREALRLSQSNSKDDIICLRAGLYQVSEPLIYETSNGDGGKSLTIRAYQPGVILSGLSTSQILRIDTDSDNNTSTSDQGAYILIENITFRDSKSNSQGGAIYFKGSHSTLRLHNNVFAENLSHLTGGSIYAQTSNGSIEIINNTIVKSVARDGGGIYIRLLGNLAKAYVINNILWQNFSLSGGSDLSISNSLGGELNIHKNSLTLSSLILSSTRPMSIENLYFLGSRSSLSGNFQADPIFKAGLYRLSSASPLIEAGLNPLVDGLTLPDIDKDFKNRIIGTSIDIGAYEYFQDSPESPQANINYDSPSEAHSQDNPQAVNNNNNQSPCDSFCSNRDECLNFCGKDTDCTKLCDDTKLCHLACDGGHICKLCSQYQAMCPNKDGCVLPDICKICSADGGGNDGGDDGGGKPPCNDQKLGCDPGKADGGNNSNGNGTGGNNGSSSGQPGGTLCRVGPCSDGGNNGGGNSNGSSDGSNLGRSSNGTPNSRNNNDGSFSQRTYLRQK